MLEPSILSRGGIHLTIKRAIAWFLEDVRSLLRQSTPHQWQRNAPARTKIVNCGFAEHIVRDTAKIVG
ncbi:MAG: hypothetical protein RIB93_08595 [Coleofasciculus sp. D1-CHI-01]|uniref:hypothetical protein n=1 Tax=Coleofasciculus sp. D1-CHI-01 TaxID=3068482 RepID=UPI0032F9D64E